MTKLDSTSRILLTSKVREGDHWLSTKFENDSFAELIFRKICREFVQGFTEDLESKGHYNWADSRVGRFAILGTNLDRAKRLIPRPVRKYLEDRFEYVASPWSNNKRLDLVPEDRALVIETYDANSPACSDVIKWRTRNAFGKIIDNSLHPNGFGLEVSILSLGDKDLGILVPENPLDLFYVHGATARELYRDQVGEGKIKGKMICDVRN